MSEADSSKFYEVEGAVFRKRPGVPMELFDQKSGEFEPYAGDESRVYGQSNPMSLEEVRPYMDVEPVLEEDGDEAEEAVADGEQDNQQAAPAAE